MQVMRRKFKDFANSILPFDIKEIHQINIGLWTE